MSATKTGQSMIEPNHGTVGRYTPAARANHWLNAIILILLALSGMSLFHPALFFLTDLFGGGTWTRILHPWMGVALVLTFSGLFFRFWRYNSWAREDSLWMKHFGDVVAKHDENIPEVGRYNAGQKILFWGMTILILVLAGSGVVMWDARFGQYFTIEQKRLAAVIHATAAVATIGLWIVHVYAAIWVKGTVRAMTQGSVTGGWAWKHHRKWLREEVAKEPR
jgi:formate dehydrogenase subunit gamma